MIDYSRYQLIKVEKQDGVTVVTLNRPEALNSFNAQLHDEVHAIFEDLGKDEEIRSIVLTGAGRAFCAGADMKGIGTRDLDSVWGARKLSWESKKLLQDVLDLKAPIIAAVNGPAVGLGATLALFCDVIIASEKARFGDTHVKAGLVAGDGGAVIWPLLVGVAKAKELLMTGDIIDAPEAGRLGLVNRVVPHDELMPTALSFARRLADGPFIAISWTKMSINKRIRADLEFILDSSMAWELHSARTEDCREAGKAFGEKRQPHFKGR